MVVPVLLVVANLSLNDDGVPGVTFTGFGLKLQVVFAGKFDGQTKETASPRAPKPPIGTT